MSNAVATIGLDEASGSRDELDDWVIDGLDHLFSTRWAVRTGGVTDTLPTPSSATADEDTDTLAVTTASAGFEVSFAYELAPDGRSISESVTVTNLADASADYRVFGSTDFDLAASSSGEFGVYDAATSTFTQTDPANPEFIATWASDSPISGWQIPAPSLNASLDALAGTSTRVGPVDVSFAFSFDTTLAPQESETFSTTKAITIALGSGVNGDYNASGQVEQSDLNLVLQNWGVDTDVAGVPAGWVNDLPSGQIEQSELNRVLRTGGTQALRTSPATRMSLNRRHCCCFAWPWRT